MNPVAISPEEVASFRESVYQLFSRCVLQAPSPEVCSTLQDREWRESARILLGPESEDLCRDLAYERDRERLAVEHAALFVAPGPQQTFPFETSYRERSLVDGASRPGRMLGPTAVQVQRAYLDWGLPADLDTDELPDHAGVELRFMALLVAAERLSGERCAAAIQRAEADFLNGHILQWFPQWLDGLSRRARRPFYRAGAAVLRGFLETERATLDQLLETNITGAS
ncbi:MAG: molecular chaperone TorD family protein [Acidobacteria bacterium]|nr:molecular chaperone TorD family protein [Acidobacteriota bacterium]